MTYGQEIKNARKKFTTLTQNDLAFRLGITQGLLSLYESDKQEPPQETKEILQRMLGVAPHYTSKKFNDQQQKVIAEFAKLIEAINSEKDIPKIEVKVIYN